MEYLVIWCTWLLLVNLGMIWCFGFFFLESPDDLWWGVQQRDDVLASLDDVAETGQRSDRRNIRISNEHDWYQLTQNTANYVYHKSQNKLSHNLHKCNCFWGRQNFEKGKLGQYCLHRYDDRSRDYQSCCYCFCDMGHTCVVILQVI